MYLYKSSNDYYIIEKVLSEKDKVDNRNEAEKAEVDVISGNSLKSMQIYLKIYIGNKAQENQDQDDEYDFDF